MQSSEPTHFLGSLDEPGFQEQANPSGNHDRPMSVIDGACPVDIAGWGSSRVPGRNGGVVTMKSSVMSGEADISPYKSTGEAGG